MTKYLNVLLIFAPVAILGELVSGVRSQSVETDGVAFFREDEIPELPLFRVTPAQVTRLFEHYRHPDWPTDFD